MHLPAIRRLRLRIDFQLTGVCFGLTNGTNSACLMGLRGSGDMLRPLVRTGLIGPQGCVDGILALARHV